MGTITGHTKTDHIYGVKRVNTGGVMRYYPASWHKGEKGDGINLAPGGTLYATKALAKAAGQALNLIDANGNPAKGFR